MTTRTMGTLDRPYSPSSPGLSEDPELEGLLREYVYGERNTPPQTPSALVETLDQSLRKIAEAIDEGWDPQFEDAPDTKLRRALANIAQALDETPPTAARSDESSIRKLDKALHRMARTLT